MEGIVDIPSDITRLHSLGLLTALLADKTTGEPILWGSSAYEGELGPRYSPPAPITADLITGMHSGVIKTRARKNREQQKELTKKHAEVFTPSSVCAFMNDVWDAQWADNYAATLSVQSAGVNSAGVSRSDTDATTASTNSANAAQSKFENTPQLSSPETPHTPSFSNQLAFQPSTQPADLLQGSWKDYVNARVLEITCGEAPFVTSRYDAETGELIPLDQRRGFLDRKLAAVRTNACDEKEFFTWSYKALQASYGYEFQGDNLLIARINALCAFADSVRDFCGREATVKEYKKAITIIVWNFWQMDGLTASLPYAGTDADQPPALFDFIDADGTLGFISPDEEKTAHRCTVYNWRASTNRRIIFSSIQKGRSPMKFDFIIGNPPYQEDTDNGNKTYAPPCTTISWTQPMSSRRAPASSTLRDF